MLLMEVRVLEYSKHKVMWKYGNKGSSGPIVNISITFQTNSSSEQIYITAILENSSPFYSVNKLVFTPKNKVKVKVLVPQWCLTLCDPMDCIAHQTLLSMKFSRQEYWSGSPFPSPGELPKSGFEPRSPAL